MSVKTIFKATGDFFVNHFRIISSAGYAICMAVVIFVSVVLFSKKDSTFGILFSSSLCSLLMIPITLNMSHVMKSRAALEESKKDLKILSQIQEINKLKSENELTLRKLQLVEDTKFNIPVYQDVAKLTLKEIKRSGTIVKKEQIEDAKPRNYYEKIFGVSSRHKDEILSVINYEIIFKCGINLQNIRVSRINEDSILVTGITPEYTSEPVFNFTDVISELRHISLDHSGKEKRISIEKDWESDAATGEKVVQYKSDAKTEFCNEFSLKEDLELVKAARNFIQVMLAPVYKHIEFEEEAFSLSDKGLPLLSFLQNESKNCREQLVKTKEGSELLQKFNLLNAGD